MGSFSGPEPQTVGCGRQEKCPLRDAEEDGEKTCCGGSGARIENLNVPGFRSATVLY